jgi:tetratricopeptide (TPR) repeat protein
MAVIPELREKIRIRLYEEGYEVLPGEIAFQPSKDKSFDVNIYHSIRELCLRDVLNSDALVAVLGHGYGNTSDYELTGISLVESEIFQALSCQKPVWIFIVRQKYNDKRLDELIKILKKIVPDYIYEDIPETKIGDEIIKKLRHKAFLPTLNIITPLKQFITRLGFLRQPIGKDLDFRSETRFLKSKELHFLSDEYLNIDNWDPPGQDDLNTILTEIPGKTNFLEQLAEAWKILRVLMRFPFNLKQNEEYWPVWEKALNIWTNAASWSGLQGNLLIGGMASSNSLLDLRMHVLRKNGGDEQLHGVILAHAVAASQTYSTVKFTNNKELQSRYFRSVFAHLNQAESLIKDNKFIENRGDICSTRGNVLVRMGRVEEAIEQFREGVIYKEQSGVPYPALKVDLGYSLMLNGKKREAEKLMEDGLYELEKAKRKGYIIRAKRKMAIFYFRSGSIKKALRQYLEAEALARYFGANDQLPPGANQLEMLRKKLRWKLGALQVIDDKKGYRYSEIEDKLREE